MFNKAQALTGIARSSYAQLWQSKEVRQEPEGRLYFDVPGDRHSARVDYDQKKLRVLKVHQIAAVARFVEWSNRTEGTVRACSTVV